MKYPHDLQREFRIILAKFEQSRGVYITHPKHLYKIQDLETRDLSLSNYPNHMITSKEIKDRISTGELKEYIADPRAKLYSLTAE